MLGSSVGMIKWEICNCQIQKNEGKYLKIYENIPQTEQWLNAVVPNQKEKLTVKYLHTIPDIPNTILVSTMQTRMLPYNPWRRNGDRHNK